MNQEEYIRSQFTRKDSILQEVLKSIEERNMPAISVPPEVGKMITLIAKLSGARQALEIGALGGYSGIHIIKGLPDDGRLTSLELVKQHAELAGKNIEKAGFGKRVSYLTGPALDSLEKLATNGHTFDLFLIDADKGSYENYLERSIELANPGAVILADNTLQSGRVHDFDENDKITVTMRRFNERVANHPKLESLLVPIGDGLVMARVKG